LLEVGGKFRESDEPLDGGECRASAVSGTPGKASGAADIVGERRRMLKKLGRFAVVSAPAVTLLLAANLKPKTAVAAS